MQRKSRINLKNLQMLAAANFGSCLDIIYSGIRTNYTWQCKEGHKWSARADSIKTGRWCPECGGAKPRDLSWLQNIAKSNNGICLSTEYVNNFFKYEWKCSSQEHRSFLARPTDILHVQKWCPECQKAKHILKYYTNLCEIARTHNGYLLSSRYINNVTKYEWKCQKGHIWTAKANCVQQGAWCPLCFDSSSKPEKELREYAKNIVPDVIKTRNILSNKRFELDIYSPSLKKAIEFQGKYWHSLPDAVRRDPIKRQQCMDAGIDLLIVHEVDWISNKPSVLALVKNFLAKPRSI